KVTRGSRHGFLMSVAGQFRFRGMDENEIFAALTAVNESRCDPPKPVSELRGIVQYVCSKPAGFSNRGFAESSEQSRDEGAHDTRTANRALLEAAQMLTDQLPELLKANPAKAFESYILESLAFLYREDPVTFAKAKMTLKKAG